MVGADAMMVMNMWKHRRRINTEEKAKVVTAAWRTEIIKFFAPPPILHQDDLKNMMNSSYSEPG